jgi:hypothetical protein
VRPIIPNSLRAALLLIALTLPAATAHGFVCLHTDSGACMHWSPGSATLRTLLGNAGQQLMNGTFTWDQNVFTAATQWNMAGAIFQFTVVSGGALIDECNHAAGQCAGVPGDNQVFFAASHCGSNFGDIVAQTDTCAETDTGIIVNAPVFVNDTAPFDAYDGALQPPLNDMHRVLLHEFGHVVGLDHPDQHGQTVSAIMNSDTDRLQPDDIAGIQFLYRNNAAPTSGCQIDAPGRARATWLLVVPAVIALRRRVSAC